jgi:ribosomal-protein-serine acetyltransferase
MMFSKGVNGMLNLKVDHEINLQLIQHQDSSELFQLVENNRIHLREWLPWVDSITSSHQYFPIISTWLKQYADHNGFNAGIRLNGKLVGVISLNSIDWYNQQTALGYYLGAGYEGKGIMTRTVQAVLTYIFLHLRLHRVEVRCGVHNNKSRAIPERLGFRQEGVIRDGEFLNDHYHDLVVYGMLSHDWFNQNHN